MVTMIIIYYLVLLQPKMYLAAFNQRKILYCNTNNSRAQTSQAIEQPVVREVALRTPKEVYLNPFAPHH